MFEEIKDNTVLVTGATGLIGQALVRRLLECEANVTAAVRDIEKANKLFDNDTRINYIVSDICCLKEDISGLDYIIHAAANTSSKAFQNDPTGIAYTSLEGTRRTLEIARKNNLKNYVYLSSMEVYGIPETDEKIDELHSANIDLMKPRSSYPESKRMCESMCASYHSQYGVPVNVVRLTQTFGAGVRYDDGRVFAEFARCAIEKKEIILHTKGETKRNYLYIEDAVNAILTVMLKGVRGEAYNAANESTYCSIMEMAQLVAAECAGGTISVRIEPDSGSCYGYAPTLHMNLDTSKLSSLGWKAEKGLKEMFDIMIADMKNARGFA